MEKIKSILRNKPLAIGLAIVMLVILLAIFGGQDAKDGTSSPLSSPTSNSRLEIIDLNEQKRRQAADYRASIASNLPIYLEGFKTSVGIDTTINLYYLSDDPESTVRLEIYGLSYLNSESDPSKNSNVQAYKESYEKAISELRARNIDPKKLIFIYGDKEYVRETTLKWIGDLKLSP